MNTPTPGGREESPSKILDPAKNENRIWWFLWRFSNAKPGEMSFWKRGLKTNEHLSFLHLTICKILLK